MPGRLILLSSLIWFSGLMACRQTDSQPQEPLPPRQETAIANLSPTEGSQVTGSLAFTEEGDRIQITGQITGLTAGTRHGFHIHEHGDCSAPDAASAGAHFDPDGNPHGRPSEAPHHAGDLGNIEADQQGLARVNITVDSIGLGAGPRNVVGRSVVVHKDPDDYVTQPDGGAGDRLACGVIETDVQREGSGPELPGARPSGPEK